MDNQLVQSNVCIKQVLLTVVTVICIVLAIFLGINLYQRSDPFVSSVFSLEGDASRGREIFQINCAACHGIAGNGKVGPSLQRVAKRKSSMGLIHQVVGGKTPPMPKFQANPQEMADLLKYLEQL
ncbi:c-type cytochrome [Lusitaniella coriacea]|uniref:c-type cytochrome n=1 Tax=Lusitaniella coriacea TaxID=1983105 RepID=UPI003CF0DA8F